MSTILSISAATKAAVRRGRSRWRRPLRLLALLAAVSLPPACGQSLEVPQAWANQAPALDPTCGGRRFDVAPEKMAIVAVPWDSLADGDVVNIYAANEPYRFKARLSEGGKPGCPVVINGVVVDGIAPTITGDGAESAADIVNEQWATFQEHVEQLGLFVLFRGPDDGYPSKPAHITFQNLRLVGANQDNSFRAVNGEMRSFSPAAAAVFAPSGGADDILIQNCEIADNGNGIFSNTVGAHNTGIPPDQALVSKRWTIRQNVIYSNGVPGIDREHNLYLQGEDTLVEQNWIGPLRNGALGAAVKDRSSGTVIRHNVIYSGTRILDLVDSEGGFGYFAEDLDKYDHAVVNGNVLVNDHDLAQGPKSTNMIHWGGDTEIQDPSGRPVARLGTLDFSGNTVVVRATSGQSWRIALFDGHSGNNVRFSNNLVTVVGDTRFAWMRHGHRVEVVGPNLVHSQFLYQDREQGDGGDPVSQLSLTGTLHRDRPDLADPFNVNLTRRDYSARAGHGLGAPPWVSRLPANLSLMRPDTEIP